MMSDFHSGAVILLKAGLMSKNFAVQRPVWILNPVTQVKGRHALLVREFAESI